MGVYDPSRDKDVTYEAATEPQRKESEDLRTQIRSVFNAANDFTANSFNKMFEAQRKLMKRDFNPYTFLDDPSGGNPIFDSIRALYGTYRRPDGYVSYPIPSTDAYSDCKAKQGLAAWDTRGYWHCIFPQAAIMPDALADPDTVTREDIEADVDHSRYGLLFENFNDLMDWRVQMKKNLDASRNDVQQSIAHGEQNTWDFFNHGSTKNADGDIYDIPAASTNNVARGNDGSGSSSVPVSMNVSNTPSNVHRISESSSSSTSMKTLDNGDIEKITHVKNYYADGTSSEKTTTEVIDHSTGQSRVVNSSDSGRRKGGWFWDKK